MLVNQIEDDKKLQELYQKQNEDDIPFKQGAFDPEYIYISRMKNNIWRPCKIVEVLLINKESYVNEQINHPYDYRYYVHWFGVNRWMDDWVTFENIVKTPYLVSSLKKYRKTPDAQKIEFYEQIEKSDEEGLEQKEQETHEKHTKVKTISQVQIGPHTIDTWYFSPFPEGYHTYGTLFICDFCLSFFTKETELKRHSLQCKLFHPPGNQIYEDTKLNIAVFEVDGNMSWVYAENLAYLSKLFLDHKYIYYSMSIFNFYVLTEKDDLGYHFVGYFSKNKETTDQNNLSCILVLPCFQKNGYGKFLINFSYALSEVEKKIGTPERPLSDLGKLVYMRFWAQRIIDYIKDLNEKQLSILSIKKISEMTSIQEQDVVDALEDIKILKQFKNQYYLCFDQELIKDAYKRLGEPAIFVDINRLHWMPKIEKFEAFA